MSQLESNSHFSQEESCHSCALKTVCKQTEEDCFTRGQRWKAVLLAYIIPVVLILIAVIVNSVLGKSDVFMAVSTIVGVGIYYFILWLVKPKI